jgi:hypothetical protein
MVGAVEGTLETLRQVAMLTQAVSEGSEQAVVPQMETLVGQLQAIDRLKGGPVGNMMVPPEVLELIDHGLMPDELTRRRMEAVEHLDAKARGQKSTFHGFAELLEKKQAAATASAAAAREVGAGSGVAGAAP